MLDKIISFSIRNKLLVAIMTVALVAWGVWSALRLPIDAVPDITDNQVQIITSSPTLATQEVEQLITAPIEQAIARCPDCSTREAFRASGCPWSRRSSTRTWTCTSRARS